MGYNPSLFTAAILSMAEKGALVIEEYEKDYAVCATGKNQEGLSSDEKKIYEILFEKENSVMLTRSQFSLLSKAVKAFKTHLSLTYEKNYFLKNRHLFIPGLVFSGVCFIATLILSSAHLLRALCFLAFDLSVGLVFLSRVVGKQWKVRWRAGCALQSDSIHRGGGFYSFYDSLLGAELFVIYAYFFASGFGGFTCFCGMVF